MALARLCVALNSKLTLKTVVKWWQALVVILCLAVLVIVITSFGGGDEELPAVQPAVEVIFSLDSPSSAPVRAAYVAEEPLDTMVIDLSPVCASHQNRTILLWTLDIFHEQEQFSLDFESCNCNVTDDREAAKYADAILFHWAFMGPLDMPTK